MERLRQLIKATIALTIVSGAGVSIAWLIASRPRPPLTTRGVRVPQVQVLEATPRVFDVPVIAYGSVRPKRQIRVIPQVSGTLTYAHPDLAVGNIIRKGELLFEIDRQPYESRVLQVKAEVKRLQLHLQRQQQEEINLTKRLEVACRQLELACNNLERNRTLRQQDAVTQTEVDAARQKYLHSQDKVLVCENQLKLIPHVREEIMARLAGWHARLADAERNLEYTTLHCPFDAQVDTVTAQESQVVVANFAVAVLTDLEAFELAAVLHPSDLEWMHERAFARALGDDMGDAPPAAVTWTAKGGCYRWTGNVTRLERYDEATRTARLVVEIPDPLGGITFERTIGEPQLSIGMFCRVAIPAEPVLDALLIPRSAIHEDNVVYVFEPDVAAPDGRLGRLAPRHVPILRTVGADVLVGFAGRSENGCLAASDSGAICDLEPGDLVVVSSLPSPVYGMRLRLRHPADPLLADARFGQFAAWTSARPGVPTLPQHAPAEVAWTGGMRAVLPVNRSPEMRSLDG